MGNYWKMQPLNVRATKDIKETPGLFFQSKHDVRRLVFQLADEIYRFDKSTKMAGKVWLRLFRSAYYSIPTQTNRNIIAKIWWLQQKGSKKVFWNVQRGRSYDWQFRSTHIWNCSETGFSKQILAKSYALREKDRSEKLLQVKGHFWWKKLFKTSPLFSPLAYVPPLFFVCLKTDGTRFNDWCPKWCSWVC